MCKLAIALAVSAVALAGCNSTSPTVSEDAPTVYLNSNIGYNQGKYSYAQDSFPCQVGEKLVENIIGKAAGNNIRVVSISSQEEIKQADNILAVDITDLPDSQRNFVGSKSVAPKLGVAAVFTKANAQSKLNQYEGQCTGVLGHGGVEASAYGNTSAGGGSGNSGRAFCKEMRRCSRILSQEIADWLSEEVQ